MEGLITTIMKYIKPAIKVREIAAEGSILAASSLVESNGGYIQTITDESNSPISNSGAILGKKNLFDDSWDEDE